MYILPGLAVEPPQPVEARLRAAGLNHRVGEDLAEDRPHRAAGQRIADDDLVVPALVEQIVPVGGRLVLADRVAVVDDDRRRLVQRVVEPLRVPVGRIERCGPGRLGRRQQAFGGAPRQDRRGTAEPHVRLRVRPLRTDPVVDLLRPHVEPAHVDVGPRLLVRLLDDGQQIPAMRRVNDQRRPAIAPTARHGRGRRETEDDRSTAQGVPHRPPSVRRVRNPTE